MLVKPPHVAQNAQKVFRPEPEQFLEARRIRREVLEEPPLAEPPCGAAHPRNVPVVVPILQIILQKMQKRPQLMLLEGMEIGGTPHAKQH